MEKVALQQKLQSVLTKYNGFWVYVFSPAECFEGRLDFTRVRICQDSSVLIKDLMPLSHQIAVTREDYELIHTSSKNIYTFDVYLKGVDSLVPSKLDLTQCLCSFADAFANHHEFRLLSIRDYQNDEPEESDYDWLILVIIEYRGPQTECEQLLAAILQEMRVFWLTQHREIKIYHTEYTRISSVFLI